MLVNALDQRIPDAPGEVQVYIGKRSDVLGNEALQTEVPHNRVDVADADEVAHHECDGRAASSARRPALQRNFGTHQAAFQHNLPRHPRYVAIQQQEAGHAVHLDQPELLLQALLNLLRN